MKQNACSPPKGQLISECLFGALNYPKNQQQIWQISTLETKKWSNQQSKGTFLYCYDYMGYLMYSLFTFKSHKSIFKNFINEKFRKWFYFFTCILPDYVPHESFKEFWKNSHFKNTRASFLLRCQNTLRQTTHEMMHFQA